MRFFTFDGVFSAGFSAGPLPVGRLFETESGLRLVSETASGSAEITTTGGAPTLGAQSGLGGWAPTMGFAGLDLVFRAHDLAGVSNQTNGQSIEIFEGSSGLYADSFQAVAFGHGGRDFLALGDQSGAGFATYTKNSEGQFEQIDFVDQTSTAALSGVTGLAHATVQGKAFLVAISQGNNFISAFEIDGDGQIEERASLGAADHLPIAGPSDVDVLEIFGQHFVVVASAQSSSLTVLQLEADGALTPIDQVMDDRNTRFQGVDQIECFEHDGRAYIIAAGQDEGLSLFSLLPNGRIVHLETIADSLDASISKVADMEVVIDGGVVHLYTLGAAEAGITQFTLNLGTQGHTRIVTGTGHRATHDIDVLVASEGDDSLEGRNDADILMDASGADTLFGGWGADLFILGADGKSDTVADFQPGADSLDLSDWGFLRSADQLTITTTQTGAVLEFGNEQLVVNSMRDTPLDASHFTDETILNASHIDLTWVGQTVEPEPEPESEPELEPPTDPRPPLDGPTAIFQSTWDAGHTAPGTNEDRVFMMGDKGSDTLYGNNQGNELSGFSGEDRLMGQAGGDTLFGGTGGDVLDGGQGDDVVFGDQGNDTLVAGIGADTLYGGSGDDVFLFNAQTPSGPHVISDFDTQQDIMALRGIDGRFDALNIRTVTSGGKEYTEIAYDDQIILLEDVQSTEIDTTDFWFL